jgi:hypothetical protein
MESKVNACERREVVAVRWLPDGEYEGSWTGYFATCTIAGVGYRLATEDGVRGMAVPCVVTVKAGAASVRAK